MRALCAQFGAYALGKKKGHDFDQEYPPMAGTTTELLTTDQLAERLNVKPRTIQGWGRTGRIPSVRISHKVIRYDWQKVFEALRSMEITRISHRA